MVMLISKVMLLSDRSLKKAAFLMAVLPGKLFKKRMAIYFHRGTMLQKKLTLLL